MKYEAIVPRGREEVESALSRDDTEELSSAVVSAALYSDDSVWAEDLCLRLAGHADANVRGNAVLGFGHIARIHGRLDEGRVSPLIEAALRDESQYVRGHAESAADDVEHFLGWKVGRPRRAG